MTEKTKKGAFIATLERNSEQIRKDRADSIQDVAEVTYRRAVEDLELELRELERNQSAMLDMSPDSTDSLILVKDFNAKRFTEKDLETAYKIRNLKLKLEIAKERCAYLFGA